jgi:hypothetical protein
MSEAKEGRHMNIPGCTCGDSAIEPGQCPYDLEINDDPESMCLCCPVCRHDCAGNI